MKVAELDKIFPQTKQEAEMNALQAAEHWYFSRSRRDDYREMAIDRVVQLKLPFEATDNSVINLFKRFVSVTCPYCGKPTECKGGGGVCGLGGGSYTSTFSCECGASVSITIGTSGFHADPGNK